MKEKKIKLTKEEKKTIKEKAKLEKQGIKEEVKVEEKKASINKSLTSF